LLSYTTPVGTSLLSLSASPENEMYVSRMGESSSYEDEVGVGKWRVRWVREENFEILVR